MIALVGHPGAPLSFDLERVPLTTWMRIVTMNVLGLRHRSSDQLKANELWRCEGWLSDLEIDIDLQIRIARIAREELRARGRQHWEAALLARGDVIDAVGPLLSEVRTFASEIATTWRNCFHRNDREVSILDNRGAVLEGSVVDGIVTVTNLYKWPNHNKLDETNPKRAANAHKALQQVRAVMHSKDLCCPDPAGRSVSTTEWPAHLPPNCPSPLLPDVRADVYRLVMRVPEHKSTTELGKNSQWSCKCERAGLSCNGTLAGVLAFRQSLLDRSPAHPLRYIARARLSPIHGKFARTGPTRDHYTLWLRAEHDPHRLFETLHEYDVEAPAC